MKAYIGADPGISGALALYIPANERSLFVEDIPTMRMSDGSRKLDSAALAVLLGQWANAFPTTTAVVESVHAMPKQGVVSSFNFGYTTGALRQAFASAGIPVVTISPQTWKGMYKLRGGAENKDMSRAKATEIFPAYSGLWARKKDHGRAEAALLAYYGSKLQ